MKSWKETKMSTNTTADDPAIEDIPIVCQQYAKDGCCYWQQNYALYKNLKTLVSTFAGSQGCLACAKNLVDLWCGIVCAPDQASHTRLSDPPYANRTDTLKNDGTVGPVLQVDIYLDPDYVCKLFNSCKSTNIVSQVTAMQTALGLLNFQGRDGAVQYGQYFTFKFNTTDNTTTEANIDTKVALQEEKPKLELFSPEVLSCDNFLYPGTETIPFPATPPETSTNISCQCSYCSKACETSSDDKIDITIEDQPISPLDGMNKNLVMSVTFSILALLIATYVIRG